MRFFGLFFFFLYEILASREKKQSPQIYMYKKQDEMDVLKHPWHKFKIGDNIVFLLL